MDRNIVSMKKYLKIRERTIKEIVYVQLKYDPQYQKYLRRIKIKLMCIGSNIVILLVMVLIIRFV